MKTRSKLDFERVFFRLTLINIGTMKFIYNICFTVFFICCFSCGNDDRGIDCTDIFVYGLNVTVTDAGSGEVLTSDVIVTAEEGSYSEVLTLIDDNFIGAGERPGNYQIIVVAAGYTSEAIGVISVELTEDECHVIPKVVEIELQAI